MNAAPILLWLTSLPVYAEDVGDPRKGEQLSAIATEIAAVASETSKPITVAALLEVTGWVETGWSLRVQDGHCRSWECDHGRARGPWQTWQNSMAPERWERMRGLDNTHAQAEVARDRIVLGLKQCNGEVRGAIARYVGKPCDARSPQLDERFKWFKRAYRALLKEDPNGA